MSAAVTLTTAVRTPQPQPASDDTESASVSIPSIPSDLDISLTDSQSGSSSSSDEDAKVGGSGSDETKEDGSSSGHLVEGGITPLPGVEEPEVNPLDQIDDIPMPAARHRAMKSISSIGTRMPGMSGFQKESLSGYDLDMCEHHKSGEPASEMRAASDAVLPYALRQRAQSAFDLRKFMNESSEATRLVQTWGIVTDPDSTNIMVRGSGYLTDRLKIRSEAQVCPLVGVELWRAKKRIDHIVVSDYQTWYSQNIDPLDDSVFVLVIHLQVESIGACFIHYHILPGGLPARTKDLAFNKLFNMIVRSAEFPDATATLPKEKQSSTTAASSAVDISAMDVGSGGGEEKSAAASSGPRVWRNDEERRKFDEECDDFRKNRLKLIPKLIKGPFLVKRMVQNTPCILGRAVPLKYFRGRNYLEIDAQVDDSYLSASIIRLCHSYSTSIVVDMYWTIEGQALDELPERIMAGCTVHNINFAKTTGMTPKDAKKRKKATSSMSE